MSVATALVLAGIVHLLAPWMDPRAVAPLYIGCAVLPGIVLANTQDGIARSHDWVRLALTPQFIVRQSLLIGFIAGAVALGVRVNAEQAMNFSAVAVWIAMIGQMILLNRKLAKAVAPGPRAYDFSLPLKISLPILMVEGFFVLLTYVDVIVFSTSAPPRRSAFITPSRQDAGAGVVHSLRDVGDHRAPFHRISRRRRPRAALRLYRARNQMDVLAIARGHDRAIADRQAAAVAGSGRNS